MDGEDLTRCAPPQHERRFGEIVLEQAQHARLSPVGVGDVPVERGGRGTLVLRHVLVVSVAYVEASRRVAVRAHQQRRIEHTADSHALVSKVRTIAIISRVGVVASAVKARLGGAIVVAQRSRVAHLALRQLTTATCHSACIALCECTAVTVRDDRYALCAEARVVGGGVVKLYVNVGHGGELHVEVLFPRRDLANRNQLALTHRASEAAVAADDAHAAARFHAPPRVRDGGRARLVCKRAHGERRARLSRYCDPLVTRLAAAAVVAAVRDRHARIPAGLGLGLGLPLVRVRVTLGWGQVRVSPITLP